MQLLAAKDTCEGEIENERERERQVRNRSQLTTNSCDIRSVQQEISSLPLPAPAALAQCMHFFFYSILPLTELALNKSKKKTEKYECYEKCNQSRASAKCGWQCDRATSWLAIRSNVAGEGEEIKNGIRFVGQEWLVE